MQNRNQDAVEAMLKSFKYLLDEASKLTTKVYNGIVVDSVGKDNKWNIKYNGEIHAVKAYGLGEPKANDIVKVIVPQGNQNLAWFFVPGASGSGQSGATFTPSVSEDGIISWTNDKGLPNPPSVNIKGPKGDKGEKGKDGGSRNYLPNFQKSYIQVGFASKNTSKVKPQNMAFNTKTKTAVYLTGNEGNSYSYIGNFNKDKCSVTSVPTRITTTHANDITYDSAKDRYYVADIYRKDPNKIGRATLLEVTTNFSSSARKTLTFDSELVACSYDETTNTFWGCGGESEGVFIYNFTFDKLITRFKIDDSVYGTVGQAIVQGSFMYEDKFVMVFNSKSIPGGQDIGAQLYTFDAKTGKIDGRFQVDALRGEVENGYWDGKELRLLSITAYPDVYAIYSYTLDAPVFGANEEAYVFLRNNSYGYGSESFPAGTLAQPLMISQWMHCYVRVRLIGDVIDPFPKDFMCTPDVRIDVAPADGYANPTLNGKLNIHNGAFNFSNVTLKGEYSFKRSSVSLVDTKLICPTNTPTVEVFGGKITGINVKFKGESLYSIGVYLQEGSVGFLNCTEIVSKYDAAFFALVRGFLGYTLPADAKQKLKDPVHAYENGLAINKADWDRLITPVNQV